MSETIRPLGFAKKLGMAWLLALSAGLLMWGTASLIAHRRWAQADERWRQLGLPTTFAEVTLPSIPDDQNAALAFIAAANAITAISPSNSAEGFSTTYLPYPDNWWSRAEASATGNAAVFPLALAAGKLEHANWGVNPKTQGTFAGLNDARHVARVLLDETQRRHFNADDAGAFDLLETTMALSASLRRENLIITYLVAAAIDSLGSSIIPQMAADLRIGNRPGEVPETRVRAIISRLYSEPLFVRKEVWACERLQSDSYIDALPHRHLLLGPTLTAIQAHFAEDLALAAESQGWIVATKADSTGPFNHCLRADRVAETGRRAQLSRSIAAAALMVAVYRARHGGEFPATETELVADYAAPMPNDPYRTDGGGLAYTRFGPDRHPLILGVGTAGTLPTQPPSDRWPKRFQPEPTYEPIFYYGIGEIYVWIDLALYPAPTPATQPAHDATGQ